MEPLAKKAKLPEAVSKVLEKLLSPDPKERHKSAAKLATEVRKVLAGEAPGYDLGTFQQWVEKHVKKKARSAAPKSKAAKKAAAASEIFQGTGIVRVPPSTDGIHPRWIFYGLATMFGVALLAHFLTALFSG